MVRTEYDPHILYISINITVEMEYQVPLNRVYPIVEAASKRAGFKGTEKDVSNLINVIKKLGLDIQNIADDEESQVDNNESLKDKIRRMLEALGCQLSDAELNAILRGDIAIEEALTKDAQILWRLIFVKKGDRTVPDQDIVNCLDILSEEYALENLYITKEKQMLRLKEMNDFQYKQDRNNIKVSSLSQHSILKQTQDVESLSKKIAKLKLYVAHMQGYDRDLDHDGEYGIDPETGEIRDFECIYLADKRYSGAVIDDKERDGIDVEDIK